MNGRVICYIDGFNFYHAVDALSRPYLKWTNLWQLAEKLVRTEQSVEAVKYFSAFATWLPDAMARHQEYVAALEAAGVEPVMAHFKDKPMRCRSCGRQWVDHEEKETDVRLAIEIMTDALDDAFDTALIISADSDLVPVVDQVRRRRPWKRVVVAAPPGRHASGRHLQQAAHAYFQIAPGKLRNSLFRETVVDSRGEVVAVRPPEYAPG